MKTFTRSIVVALMCPLLGCAARVVAQTTTVTYDLSDVWLLPDTSHPRSPAQQMTGSFTWSYTPGQFAQGTGKFVYLYVPWWGTRTTPAINVDFDPQQLEFTMDGNYHNLGLDIKMRLTPTLSPVASAPIDLLNSKFQIEVGVSFQGHFSRGKVVPRCTPAPYGTGTAGSGSFVPALASIGGRPEIGNAGFGVKCDGLLGGASSFVVLGQRASNLPISGIDLLVDPAAWLGLLPLRASGTNNLPGAGSLVVPLPVPNDPRVVATSVFVQVVSNDAGGPAGATASNGLSILICDTP